MWQGVNRAPSSWPLLAHPTARKSREGHRAGDLCAPARCAMHLTILRRNIFAHASWQQRLHQRAAATSLTSAVAAIIRILVESLSCHSAPQFSADGRKFPRAFLGSRVVGAATLENVDAPRRADGLFDQCRRQVAPHAMSGPRGACGPGCSTIPPVRKEGVAAM